MREKKIACINTAKTFTDKVWEEVGNLCKGRDKKAVVQHTRAPAKKKVVLKFGFYRNPEEDTCV